MTIRADIDAGMPRPSLWSRALPRHLRAPVIAGPVHKDAMPWKLWAADGAIEVMPASSRATFAAIAWLFLIVGGLLIGLIGGAGWGIALAGACR